MEHCLNTTIERVRVDTPEDRDLTREQQSVAEDLVGKFGSLDAVLVLNRGGASLVRVDARSDQWED